MICVNLCFVQGCRQQQAIQAQSAYEMCSCPGDLQCRGCAWANKTKDNLGFA